MKIIPIIENLLAFLERNRQTGHTTAAVLGSQANPNTVMLHGSEEASRFFKNTYSSCPAIDVLYRDHPMEVCIDHVKMRTLGDFERGNVTDTGPLVVDNLALMRILQEAALEINRLNTALRSLMDNEVVHSLTKTRLHEVNAELRAKLQATYDELESTRDELNLKKGELK